MSDEIRVRTTGGLGTILCLIWRGSKRPDGTEDDDGEAVFVEPEEIGSSGSPSEWLDGMVECTEQEDADGVPIGRYVADWPANITTPGDYDLEFFAEGPEPSSDPIATQFMPWAGNASSPSWLPAALLQCDIVEDNEVSPMELIFYLKGTEVEILRRKCYKLDGTPTESINDFVGQCKEQLDAEHGTSWRADAKRGFDRGAAGGWLRRRSATGAASARWRAAGRAGTAQASPGSSDSKQEVSQFETMPKGRDHDSIVTRLILNREELHRILLTEPDAREVDQLARVIQIQRAINEDEALLKRRQQPCE